MRVGVVGAGITGLAAVHHLRKRGIEAVCIEAQEDPGGVIRSFRAGDRDGRGGQDRRVLEGGPQRLRLTEGIGELIDDLGLWSEVLLASEELPIYVYSEGKLREVPRSLRAFLRTDLLSARGKCRVLAEPLTAPGTPEESAAELFARKFGREAAESLVGPLFGGTYGSDPARMPARHALSGLIDLEAREGSLLKPALERIVLGESPPPISFAEGLQQLPRSLRATHADRVHLGTPVRAIERAGTGMNEDDGRFVLATPEGEEEVDRVAVTVDARTAAGLFDSVGARGLDGLGNLRYNPLAVVHLDSDFAGAGFGYQIRWDEPATTLGVTWNASLFDREGVYTAFLGGMKDPAILDRDDEELGETAAREFEAVLGQGAEVLSVTRWEQGFPAYDASWDALGDLELPEGIDLLTNYTARAGVSSRIGQAKELAERVVDERERREAIAEPPTPE